MPVDPKVAPADSVPAYQHTPLFPLGKDNTPYRQITAEGVKVQKAMGRDILAVEPTALTALSPWQ